MIQLETGRTFFSLCSAARHFAELVLFFSPTDTPPFALSSTKGSEKISLKSTLNNNVDLSYLYNVLNLGPTCAANLLAETFPAVYGWILVKWLAK